MGNMFSGLLLSNLRDTSSHTDSNQILANLDRNITNTLTKHKLSMPLSQSGIKQQWNLRQQIGQ